MSVIRDNIHSDPELGIFHNYVTMDQHSQMDQIQSDWITLDYLYMYDAYKKYIFHMYYPLVNIQKTMEHHPF